MKSASGMRSETVDAVLLWRADRVMQIKLPNLMRLIYFNQYCRLYDLTLTRPIISMLQKLDEDYVLSIVMCL